MEAALSIYLENYATTLGSREQLAIAEVADAPRSSHANSKGVNTRTEIAGSATGDGDQRWFSDVGAT